MKKTAAILCFLIVLSCVPTSAQRSVEAYGFIGYTGVNVEDWAGTGFPLREYDQFNSGYYLQVFPYANELFSVGLEYGYSYLLYYTFFNEFTTVERNVDATRLLAMIRLFPQEKIFFEGGLGYYFFDGFSDFTVGLAAGYRFKVLESLSIPIKFRNNFIFDSAANIIQPGIDIGVAYGF